MLETYSFVQIEWLYIKDRLEMSLIGDMKITFITEFRFMTFNLYIDMPKQMVEWNLIRKKHEAPKFIRLLQKMPESD